MKNLPLEILVRIFLQLCQHDKLECMKVCQHWNYIVHEYVLYHTVRIRRPKKLDHLQRTVQLDPTQGHKVECLLFDWFQPDSFNFNSLIQHFPNVRSFIMINREYNDACLTMAENEQGYSWTNIEYIEERYTDYFTQHLLTLNTYAHLTNITVAAKDLTSGKTLVHLFSNAPSLEYLKMTRFFFTLDDIESLHERTPHLRSLTLYQSKIDCEIGPSYEIKPAESMVTLELVYLSLRSGSEEIKLLRYLHAKYPNLVHLGYEVIKIEAIESTLYREYTDQLANLLYGINTSLKKISLRLNNKYLNPFELLDNAECKVEAMTLSGKVDKEAIQTLAISAQAKHIQQLVLRSIPPGLSLKYLTHFDALEDLQIVERGVVMLNLVVKVDIEELLLSVPSSLKSLTLGGIGIEIPGLPKARSYSLNKLSLISCDIPHGLDFFITERCPDLKNLMLYSCYFKSITTWILHKSNLNCLKMECGLSVSRDDIFVISLKKNERRRYKADTSSFLSPLENNDPFIFPATVSEPDPRYSHPPLMTVVVNSVNRFFLINRIN